ncbi:MAG: glycosyltransferase family 39 protein [Anaerolineales bacterium]|nr:glycosyltransferase family 39 protein [Anaerolineales bacterium]
MTLRAYLILFVLALILPVAIAQFQPIPGYLDSDYYYAGGLQLVSGRGFTEPYMWNYLDGSLALPHPSHGYWQPLASLVAALGMWLTGRADYASARLFFILIAGVIPPLTAYLAYLFTQRRDLALASACLAIFSVYSAPFLGVTDNFGIFMLLGGLYFIFVSRILQNSKRLSNWFWLGLFAGLMTLARSDGLLWLAIAFLFGLLQAVHGFQFKNADYKALAKTALPIFFKFALIALIGFLLIMTPWYLRNLNVYGSLMAPGGSRALWLANYDQTFSYPPDLLNKEAFFALGWRQIILDRLGALKDNALSAFAAHGAIILFPFILIGIYANRKDMRVKLAVYAWLILFSVMTLLFPFAGARGAFFHAGAAFQPLWWALTPLGLDAFLDFLKKKKNWGDERAKVVFRAALTLIAAILTVFVVYLRLFSLGWSEGEENYPPIEQFLLEHNIQPGDIVIVRNPPGYYISTNRSALPIPYGGEETILAVAEQFGAKYFILEKTATLNSLKDLYKTPTDNPHFIFLGEIDEAKIFRIESK